MLAPASPAWRAEKRAFEGGGMLGGGGAW
eukprot:COSAG02_NODE_34589_length_481_cov_3.434555_1_plen_28_part_10